MKNYLGIHHIAEFHGCSRVRRIETKVFDRTARKYFLE